MRTSFLLAGMLLVTAAPALACDRDGIGGVHRYNPLAGLLGSFDPGLTPEQELLLAAIDAEAQRKGAARPMGPPQPVAEAVNGSATTPSAAPLQS